jgi:intracellular sulfur oxidation DsrE/DsrF family protein
MDNPPNKEDLIEQATTIDSGVAQVIRKQGVGWAHIKAGS